MRFSKFDMFTKAALALALAIVFHVVGADFCAGPFFIVSLCFFAWLGQKYLRDYLISTGQPTIREVHAHHEEPPEQMSRGSRGLPTNFD